MNTLRFHARAIATVLTLSAIPTSFADCDHVIDHPSKFTYGVNILTTSSLVRPNPDFQDCLKQFEELVPTDEDGFSLETFCESVSIADVMVDGEPAAYARSQGIVMMEGEIANDGFSIALHQVGRVEEVKGETSVLMDHYILYPFDIGHDLHFTFVHDSTTPMVEDAFSSVVLVDMDTGIVRDMTGIVNDLPENADPIEAGSYELRILAQFDQSGADNYVEVASDRVDMQFHCKYDLIPADINRDGLVNGLDLAHLLGAFNTYEFDADINGDGKVDGEDLAMLLGAWTG